jgi:hypothetical protein
LQASRHKHLLKLVLLYCTTQLVLINSPIDNKLTVELEKPLPIMPRSKVHKAILVCYFVFKRKLVSVTSKHQIISGVGGSTQAARKFVSIPVGTVIIESIVGGNPTLFTNIGEFAGGLAESAECWASSIGFLSFEASSIDFRCTGAILRLGWLNKAFVVGRSHASLF